MLIRWIYKGVGQEQSLPHTYADFALAVFCLLQLPTISCPILHPRWGVTPLLTHQSPLNSGHCSPHIRLATTPHVARHTAGRLVRRIAAIHVQTREIKWLTTSQQTTVHHRIIIVEYSTRTHGVGNGGKAVRGRSDGLWDAALRITYTFKLRVEQLVERGAHYVAVGAARRVERHLVEYLHVVQLRSFGHTLLFPQVHPVRLVQDLRHTHI